MRSVMIVCVVIFLSACSSDDHSQTAADAALEATSAKDTSVVGDATSTLDSSSEDAAPMNEGDASQGACAACTANQCLPQLQTCGATQDCVDDLVTFNNCLSAHDANCGTTFAAGGSDQASLWSCLEAMCMNVCGSS